MLINDRYVVEIFGKLLKISRLPRSTFRTYKSRNLLINLTEFLLIFKLQIFTDKCSKYLSFFLGKKIKFLDLFRFQGKDFLLFHFLYFCFLEDALLVSFYEVFCQFEAVYYWVSLSSELVQFDFMIKLIFLNFIQKFKLIYLSMTQIFQPQFMYIIILQFPKNRVISDSLYYKIDITYFKE